ncbi:MAG: sulfatase [Puniceicoccaceae bacterium]
MKKLITALLLLAIAGCAFAAKRPNILFIAADDLRTELGCYGSEIAVTPHLDALAADGLLFENAYCQQAICGPSRASLMTGLRPDTSGITHNYLEFRDLNPDIVTLPQYFIQQGYETVYHGKIFHGRETDDKHSWSRKPATIDLPRATGFALQENRERQAKMRVEMEAKYGEQARFGLASGVAWECADVADYRYADGYSTEVAMATLKELVKDPSGSGQVKPFFLALGFRKPHLNWVAPKKYWDFYDRDKIPVVKDGKAPEGGAAMGLHPGFELRVRDLVPDYGPIDEDLARTLKHAYLACASYIDAQVGKMVAALEEAGVRDNTIIIFWSDHGWHLGEMGTWGKATNYEVATRVPMIIWTPDMPDSTRGRKTDALVELIDMYPSLCELAGLKQPKHLEGSSFKPLLEDPDRNWKKASFSQFPSPALREWGSIALRPGMRETYFGPLIEDVEALIQEQMGDKWDRKLFEEDLMGYAMRTERYRFIIWKDTKHPEADPLFIELYDHEIDPEESRNIADDNPEIVETLLAQFNQGWKGSLPE